MINKPVYIIIHCSSTKENQDFSISAIEAWHKRRGFNKIGYHYYIRKDGRICKGREEKETGAHDNDLVQGKNYSYNRCSIGICYEGGLDGNGKAKDTRTPAQKEAMKKLIQDICNRYPILNILGHRDTSPDKNKDGKITPDEYRKECPCFDAQKEYSSFLSVQP